MDGQRASGRHSLSLSAIALATVIALGHEPRGLRLAPLASLVDSPRSSVERALAGLASSGLVLRVGPPPVRYRLTRHPARDAVMEAALLLSDPRQATSIALRASPAVGYVAEHRRGFVVILATDADPLAVDRLHRSLATLGDAAVRAPKVRIVELHELARLRPRPLRQVVSDPPGSDLGSSPTTRKIDGALKAPRPPAARVRRGLQSS